MKNPLGLFGIIVLGLVIGFSMAACDNSGDNSGDITHTHQWSAWYSSATQHWKDCDCGEEYGRDNHIGNPCSVCSYTKNTSGETNPFIGSWEGTILYGYEVDEEILFTGNTWSFTKEYTFYTGTYSRNGNIAYLEYEGNINAGTAIISGNTLTFELKDEMDYTFTGTFTKKAEDSGTGGTGGTGGTAIITDNATAKALVQEINSMIDTICFYGINPKLANDQTPYTITMNGTVSGSVYVEGPKYYGGYQEGWPSYGFKTTSTNAQLSLNFTNYANASSLKIISGNGSYDYWKQYGGQQESGNYTLNGDFTFSYGGKMYGGTLSVKRSWAPKSSYMYGTTIYTTVYKLEYLYVNGKLLLAD